MREIDVTKGHWGTHTPHPPGVGAKHMVRRPADGWRNTCKPEVRAGGPIMRARKRLAKRVEDYERIAKDRSGYNRPGSLQP